MQSKHTIIRAKQEDVYDHENTCPPKNESIPNSSPLKSIIGGKRQVSCNIYQCITCCKLQVAPQTQKMADRPPDHLSVEPPFTNIGLDVFDPWTIVSCRTRGGLAHSKCWAVIFSCMTARAVHMEVIESLDTTSFINAIMHLFAVRGPLKKIRSEGQILSALLRNRRSLQTSTVPLLKGT